MCVTVVELHSHTPVLLFAPLSELVLALLSGLLHLGRQHQEQDRCNADFVTSTIMADEAD